MLLLFVTLFLKGKRKMKKIRITALLLALLTLALCFASCANTGDGSDTTANQGNNGSATATPETSGRYDADGFLLDDLPELNYNQEEIVLFTWSNQVKWEWRSEEEANADKIAESIYKRQIDVEARLNIKFNIATQSGDWGNRNAFITAVEANVDAGQNEAFDIIGQYTPAAPIGAMKNLYLNLADEELEYLDFEKPWWPEDIKESCSINNNVYFLTGDITGTLVRNVQSILCNLDLADAHQLPDVYKLVDDKEWTMDKFIEVACGTISGINPDGSPAMSVTIANDVTYDNLFYAGGFRFVENDQEGNLIMSPDLTNSDRLESWYQTCKNLLADNADVSIMAVNADNGFTSGNVLFHFGQIADVQNSLQDVDFDFAILPYPMFNKDQGEYYSITSYWVTMYSIPTNANDPKMSAAVLEALGSAGYRTITPVIYSESFQYRFLDTPENAAMFDLLHDTLVFDPGHIFADQLNCFAAFREAAKGSYDSWATCYAAKGKTWEIQLKKIIDNLG